MLSAHCQVPIDSVFWYQFYWRSLYFLYNHINIRLLSHSAVKSSKSFPNKFVTSHSWINSPSCLSLPYISTINGTLISHILNFLLFYTQLFTITWKRLHIFFVLFSPNVFCFPFVSFTLSTIPFFNHPPTILSLRKNRMIFHRVSRIALFSRTFQTVFPSYTPLNIFPFIRINL